VKGRTVPLNLFFDLAPVATLLIGRFGSVRPGEL